VAEAGTESVGGERPLGEPTAFTAAARPERRELVGAYVTLSPVVPERDADGLFTISHAPDGDPEIWTYLPDGPFSDVGAYRSWLETAAQSKDPQFFTALVDGRPAGVLSLLAIVPEHGTIEIGHVWFGPQLQRTPAATEAIFLLARYAFDELGYRRLEWKCNALNAASRRAAERFGFRYEGTFAQHRVFKGRNRDTAWFAITDARWPTLRAGFSAWLAPANFDADGRQRQSLAALRKCEDTATGEGHRA
jgi:RimJ/RimL family protein N-acetyltransferase